MENKQYYIKYLTNGPVKVETHYTGEKDRRRPLTDVGDLIAAYKTAVAPRFDSTPTDELTLHLPGSISRSASGLEEDCFANVDSTDTTLDSGCPLSSLGAFGSKSKQPLIIKSNNDMEVDSSPTTSDSSKSSVNIKNDGIDIDTEHLERLELVEKLTNLVSSNSIVLLTSPAGSGKSSLFKLYKAATKKKVIGISCFKDKTLFEVLKAKGIDFETEHTKEELLGKHVVIFLDDAQAKYHEIRFWEELVKAAGLWLPKNIKFIVSATHSLNGGRESPVEFESLPRLSRQDFLLSEEEAYQFLDFSDIGLPQKMSIFPNLKSVLVNESGGLIAALRLSVDSLKESFMKDSHPTETALLQHSFSNAFVQRMARCFGSRHSKPVGDDFKHFLKKCFAEDRTHLNGLTNQQDEDSYSFLKKAGILLEFPDSTFGFSSLLAKRYYFKWIFPNRSPTPPLSLSELIRNVIGNISASILKKSTTQGDFPKEAVFQHLFMEGLAAFTPPDCCICPELSKIFPSGIINSNSQQTIPGEIDFYLNGDLRWGIELLVNGDGIGEHISRFTVPDGKYVALAVSDYAVVDFRRNSTGQPTNISKHSNRITVFFKKDDYSIAHCIFGEDSDIVEINLSN